MSLGRPFRSNLRCRMARDRLRIMPRLRHPCRRNRFVRLRRRRRGRRSRRRRAAVASNDFHVHTRRIQLEVRRIHGLEFGEIPHPVQGVDAWFRVGGDGKVRLAVSGACATHRVVIIFGADAVVKICWAGETVGLAEVVEGDELGAIGGTSGERNSRPELQRH